jgi:hypothetical protein
LNSHTQFLGDALMTLKGMLLASYEEMGNRMNDVSIRTNSQYRYKVVEIIESPSSTWINYKADCKQILGYISSEKERFVVYWRAWGRAAFEVVNENEYEDSIRFIINDLSFSFL